jgi:hypothetical protein
MVSSDLLPFFGRDRELAELRRHLEHAPLVCLHGAEAAGKSRLVAELARTHDDSCTLLECHPGDRARALHARAARALRCVPDALTRTLTHRARVLVIDNVHYLSADEAARLLDSLLIGPTSVGRVVVVGREPNRHGSAFTEMELLGLTPEAARDLWVHLEKRYGKVSGFNLPLSRSSGMPLALRREYACVRFGGAAWEVASLPPGALAALQALAVLRTPVAPAAIAALSPGVNTETELPTLLARQLVDSDGGGRFRVHAAVRVKVLAQMGLADRKRLSAAAAQFLSKTAAKQNTPPSGTRTEADPAFCPLDAIARVREIVWHWLAAGEPGRAADALISGRELAARSSGAGEFESLLDAFAQPSTSLPDGLPAGVPAGHDGACLDPIRARALATLRIEIAVRSGRYHEAFERACATPKAVPRLLRAELSLARGDTTTARQALTTPDDVDDARDHARAVAMLAELDLLAGNPTGAAAHLASLDGEDGAEPLVSVRLHLATAKLADYEGRVAATRTALALAEDTCKKAPVCVESFALSVTVATRRAALCGREGRLADAKRVLYAASNAAATLDVNSVAEEVVEAQALVARQRGDREVAASLLQELVNGRRERGNILGALSAELDLAELEAVCGRSTRAAELASRAIAQSVGGGLDHLAARAQAILAAVELIEDRIDVALPRLEQLVGSPALNAEAAAQVVMLLAIARVLSGQRIDVVELVRSASAESRVVIDQRLVAAEIALEARNVAAVVGIAHDTALLAREALQMVELVSALVVARHALVRPDHANAHATALLADRDEDGSFASVRFRSGLPSGRLLVHATLDAIGGHEDDAIPSKHPYENAEPSSAAEQSIGIAPTDSGTNPPRYQVIDARGAPNDPGDLDLQELGLARRSLAVDGVGQAVWRHGHKVVDLRALRRLKYLFLLFAAAPRKHVSKAMIVDALWSQPYDPQTHDNQVHAHISRMRKLLGDDGTKIIRADGGGYRFIPPDDFVFVVELEKLS